MPLDVPPDTTLSGEEFFRTEGAYTSLGAPIPGGQVGRWLLREGPHIDSDVELFDELCWRLVGDGLPLFRATLHMGTLHPQIRGVGARWLRSLQGHRGIPDPAGQRRDRRVSAQPDPRHDRARNAVSPPPYRGHAGISAAVQAQGFRRHRLFRASAQPQLPALSGGHLGDRPAERVQRRRYCRTRGTQSGARRDRRTSRASGGSPRTCSTPISGRRPGGACSRGRSSGRKGSSCGQ